MICRLLKASEKCTKLYQYKLVFGFTGRVCKKTLVFLRDSLKSGHEIRVDSHYTVWQKFMFTSYESVRTCRWMNCSQAFAQIRRGQPDVAGMVTKSFLSTYLIFQMREGQKVNCVLASMD